MKVYVASSWRNGRQPDVVDALRMAGHEVYDFRRPSAGDTGFHWSEIDSDWRTWTLEAYRWALDHRIAVDGFASDMAAMKWADVFVGVQPFGRSASMEMGWAAGNGKRTLLLLADGEPELMVKMFDHIALTIGEIVNALAILEAAT